MRSKRRQPPETHPPGTIVVISGDLQRYTAFAQSLVSLAVPAGSRINWAKGVNIAGNLNYAVSNADGAWVWILGDDHIFSRDTLWRLLNHGVDLVAPLVLMRNRPYSPIVFREDNPDGTFKFWLPTELPSGGLHEVAAASGAGLLIRRVVLDGMDPPYFELGRIQSTEMSEDLHFYRKARAKGFKAYVDFDTSIGHITPAALWPRKATDGRWEISVDPDCVIPETAKAP